ncbi:MAG: isoleucine--tRNA ligase [Acidobacteriota bacterium]
MDFKDTLNLPRTEFPMRARLPAREPEILARWNQADLYRQIRRARRGQPVFLLHDGPPYANGHLHLGTAMNKILKDLVVRSRAMAGYDVPFVPGWDCHGMPIELQVTRRMRKENDPAEGDLLEVRRRCAEYAARFVDVQRDEFKRLGGLAAWQDPYLTMQPAYEAAVLETFRDLVGAGYVYNGLRSIHWCADCQTALAEAEVEYAERTSPWIYVRFPLVGDEKASRLLNQHLPEGNSPEDVGVVIWTTTPWTIPANLAIAAHPELEYVLVSTGGDGPTSAGVAPARDLLLLAAGLMKEALGEMGYPEGAWEEIARFRGSALEGLTYRHVLYERTSPMVLADHVTLEQGTGLVHTAPGHGHEDFELGRAYNLDVLCPVDEAGIFDEQAGEFAGQQVFDANPEIIRALQRESALAAQGTLQHSYPRCWRCKSPLIYRATRQWFLDVDVKELRTRLLRTIREEVHWLPDWGMERIGGMVERRPDWCLSRQRAWGVPIPALRCGGCDTLRLDPEVIQATIEIVGKKGSDAWFELPLEAFLPPTIRCQKCGGSEFHKQYDIFDVWFESGVSHRAVLSSGDFDDQRWPADLYLEGHDQHRGWFQVSLITAVATAEAAPYRAVVTHGFIIDDKGRKMSKSLGNVVDPQQIVEKYGADILRLYFASVDYTRDTPFAEKLLDPVVESYRKIRNTLRFLLANLNEFDFSKDQVEPDRWQPIDRWLMAQAAVLGDQVSEAYEAFRFHRAVHRLHKFCTVTLSAIYLDIIKDRLYCSAADDPQRRSAQTVIHLIAGALMQWLAPVLPFTSEEAWQHLPGHPDESLHLATFPDLSSYFLPAEETQALDLLIDLRADVLAAMERVRAQGMIGDSLEAAVSLRPCKPEVTELLQQHAHWLAELFIVSRVVLRDAGESAAPDGAPWEIDISRAEGSKCERCWNYKASVGASADFPTLCERCTNVLESLPTAEPA